jgi:hypothetical protein
VRPNRENDEIAQRSRHASVYRPRLADPQNPDLIFSGQALEVPPPPAG